MIDDLLALGLTRIQLAAALRTVPQLLAVGVSSATPRLEKMLQQELGCDRELFLKVLLHLPRMGWQAYEMQLEVVWMKRAQALAEVRGGARSIPSFNRSTSVALHCTALHVCASCRVCLCIPLWRSLIPHPGQTPVFAAARRSSARREQGKRWPRLLNCLPSTLACGSERWR